MDPGSGSTETEGTAKRQATVFGTRQQQTSSGFSATFESATQCLPTTLGYYSPLSAPGETAVTSR